VRNILNYFARLQYFLDHDAFVLLRELIQRLGEISVCAREHFPHQCEDKKAGFK
jgi:hypothetical protein